MRYLGASSLRPLSRIAPAIIGSTKESAGGEVDFEHHLVILDQHAPIDTLAHRAHREVHPVFMRPVCFDVGHAAGHETGDFVAAFPQAAADFLLGKLVGDRHTHQVRFSNCGLVSAPSPNL